MPVDPDPNGPHLPKVLRDLVALSAVSSLWAGRDSQAIATDLGDLLATLLNLDFAFVRFRRQRRGRSLAWHGRADTCGEAAALPRRGRSLVARGSCCGHR